MSDSKIIPFNKPKTKLLELQVVKILFCNECFSDWKAPKIGACPVCKKLANVEVLKEYRPKWPKI